MSFKSAAEVLTLIKVGDRDDLLDDRAAVVTGVRGLRGGVTASEAGVTLRMGVDPSPQGWRYRGQILKAGAPFTFTTERYVLDGTVVKVGDQRAADVK